MIEQRTFKKDFFRALITDEQIERAKINTKKIMENKNHDMKEFDVYSGCLSEIVVADLFKVNLDSTKDYDFKLSSGLKIDVKCKRVKKSNPYPDHYNEIYRTNQDTDYYIFCQIIPELKTCWLMGYISKEEFMKECVFVKKGDCKPDDTYKALDNCWCMKSKYLKPFSNGFRKDLK